MSVIVTKALYNEWTDAYCNIEGEDDEGVRHWLDPDTMIPAANFHKLPPIQPAEDRATLLSIAGVLASIALLGYTVVSLLHFLRFAS